jgi:hypothetical protein
MAETRDALNRVTTSAVTIERVCDLRIVSVQSGRVRSWDRSSSALTIAPAEIKLALRDVSMTKGFPGTLARGLNV